MKVCRIIRQLLFLRQNGPKNGFNWLLKSTFFNSQQGRKKHIEEKRSKWSATDLRRIEREATRKPLSSSAVILQNCDLPEGPEVSGVQRHGQGEGGWNPHWTRHMRSRLGQETSEDRFVKGFLDWWDEGDSGRSRWMGGWISTGPRAPLPLRPQQGGGGACITKDELVWLFQVEEVRVDSKSTPNPAASF